MADPQGLPVAAATVEEEIGLLGIRRRRAAAGGLLLAYLPAMGLVMFVAGSSALPVAPAIYLALFLGVAWLAGQAKCLRCGAVFNAGSSSSSTIGSTCGACGLPIGRGLRRP